MSEESQSAEEAQQAAAKIQAGFRGYRVRKRLQEEKKAVAVAAAAAAVDGRDQDDEPTEDEDRPDALQEAEAAVVATTELEDKSATKIQAGVRGFLVRKRQQAEQAAATRIQAGFRGFRTRKLLKQSGQ